MVFFINDVPLYIEEALNTKKKFDFLVDGKEHSLHSLVQAKGDVLIHELSPTGVIQLIRLMETGKLKKLATIHLICRDQKQLSKFIKDQFKIIKAAGGIVEKGQKLLLIYRMGKWDLPKGKLDKHEKPETGAVREVEEECNIQVKREQLICKSWHTYLRNGRRIMKKTYWYRMTLISDDHMKPQLEEDIEEVRWMMDKEVSASLYNTYSSIRWVFKKYYQSNLPD